VTGHAAEAGRSGVMVLVSRENEKLGIGAGRDHAVEDHASDRLGLNLHAGILRGNLPTALDNNSSA
jgi:hypothetical protein